MAATDEINNEIVSLIREKFNDSLDEQTKSLYDERDIDRVHRNDIFIWRFIEDQKQDKDVIVANALKNISTCLAWRKEKGINDFKASDFPIEVVGSGRVRVGWDSTGRFTVVDRIGLFRKNAEWNSMLSDIVAYDMERYDLPTNGSLYLDVTGAGYSSMDLQNALSISELLTKYYPNTFNKVYMYGVPTFVKPFLNIVLGLLPERHRKRVQIIEKSVAMEQIKGLKVIMPEGCSTLEEVGRKRGISEKSIQRELKQQAWIREQCLKSDE